MIAYGFFATCVYDDSYPEDEGNIYFAELPCKDDVVVLPSSIKTNPTYGKFQYVREEDMTINVFIPDEQTNLKNQVTAKQIINL
jgi:hypothetical protein